jgi:hypothetical protein
MDCSWCADSGRALKLVLADDDDNGRKGNDDDADMQGSACATAVVWALLSRPNGLAVRRRSIIM